MDNIAKLPKTFIDSVITNTKVAAPIVLAGIVFLGIIEVVKSVKQ